MKIRRRDLERLMDAITIAECYLQNNEGLKVAPRITTREACQAAALAVLSWRQEASVTPDDEVQISVSGGFA